ncbi:GntR family transcriptional regulator [Paenibacillus flagellatus]|uniref:GntR family transcriptional regulator n=1 Tax=Paenibacillus flagellatus TaxID=2211139 RepID=A0A2V5K844_9BACL|nr:GntR family transcriptional regulator [Paenibacillus flagellatus]PYI49930.1 GntR family transcriptional regulator [Paenibacillus flagellatus]
MRIPVQVSAESAEPMYHQIEIQLRSLILSGSLPEGTLLPSIREFAQDLNCSVITIRRVYQDLENEGLLRTKQGTGTFVASVGKIEREQYRSGAVADAFRAAIETAKRVHLTRGETEKLFRDSLDSIMPEEGKGEEGDKPI